MTMPQVDGKETFLAIRSVNPEVKTIIMSGYAENEIRQRFDENEGPIAFLQKPFSAKKLINIIRAILGS